MEIKKVAISEVEVWDKNPRNIKTKDFERLKRQIQELGVYKPLICVRENGKYVTLGGNMRLRALQSLNISKVDISIVKTETEAQKIKYALSDNDRAGEYEEEKLAELVFPHIEEIDLEDFKIDIGKPISLKSVIEDYAPDIDGEDEVPEIDDSPAITKMGDLYQLGKHRLLCGDATKEKDVKRLMGGEKAEMVFTDPPYGIDLDTDYSQIKPQSWKHEQFEKAKGKTTNKNYMRITGDDKPFDYKQFAWFDCKEQFWFGADYYRKTLPDGGSWFVWDKRVDEKLDKMFGSSFELIWSREKHKREIIRSKFAGLFGTETQDVKQRLHPSQKTIEVCSWFINRFCNESKIIWDGFLGSGTTLIACEKLNRICYGMEIEPKYCDVIITRYANFTETPEEEIRATKQ